MQIRTAYWGLSPVRQSPKKVPLKLAFGTKSPYERDIQVSISDKPREQISLTQPNATSTIFIRPTDQIASMFLQDSPSSSYLAQLLEKTMAKFPNPKTPYKDDAGNVFGFYKPSSRQSDEDESAPQPVLHKMMDAFKRAFVGVLGDSKAVQVSVPKDAVPSTDLARELAEHAVLQAYNLNLLRQDKRFPYQFEEVRIEGPVHSQEALDAIKEGIAIGKGENLTRYLVDAPPDDNEDETVDDLKSPRWMGEQAKALEQQFPELRVEVHNKHFIRTQKMGLFLSVAAGNRPTDKDAPRLIETVYTPADGKYAKTVLLVGKGIIMDTGGVNLKTGKNAKTGELYIHGMHGDMAGAAAVIGAMKTIALMKPEGIRVVGLTPITPNRIGSGATVPGSIRTARNGKTVCIENTDAEGRLVLADAMHYGGEKYNPDLIVDIATLTGGKVAALGDVNAVAVMGNSSALTNTVADIARQLGRKAEAVKLTDAHRKWVTANNAGHADVYNSVGMKEGEQHNVYGQNVEFNSEKHIIHHSAQGGAFLREFLHNPKTPWVHLDMAGAEFEKLKHRGNTEFATGFGVKDLYTIVKQIATNQLNL